jgi:hypothetical protein
VTLVLPSELAAALPAIPATNDHITLWRADSGSGRPGLGAASGIADTSAVLLASNPATLSNAGDTGSLRLRLARLDLALAPARPQAAVTHATIPPGSAMPLVLPAGDKQIELALAPGVAAFAGWHDGAPLAVWGDTAAVSRTVSGGWTDLLLVNTGSTAAPADVTTQPAPATAPLQPGTVLKRFFGTAGSFDMAFTAPTGSHLMVAGGARATVIASTGAVSTGDAIPVSGPGRVIVQHEPGAVASWLDAPGSTPWPSPAPQTVSLPARQALGGPATALAFDAGGPMLLHVSTTSPVLAALHQAGRNGPPALFPAGATLTRTVTAGATQLVLFSADDGPLGGTVQIWGEPILPAAEGLGEAVTVAPGSAAAFGFTLAKGATIGIGVQANPDIATVRLLDDAGTVVGQGVAQLRTLKPGRYVLEASVPPGAPPTVLRPALVGITPRGNGPPPDVVQHYLELVGMKPQGTP